MGSGTITIDRAFIEKEITKLESIVDEIEKFDNKIPLFKDAKVADGGDCFRLDLATKVAAVRDKIRQQFTTQRDAINTLIRVLTIILRDWNDIEEEQKKKADFYKYYTDIMNKKPIL